MVVSELMQYICEGLAEWSREKIRYYLQRSRQKCGSCGVLGGCWCWWARQPGRSGRCRSLPADLDKKWTLRRELCPTEETWQNAAGWSTSASVEDADASISAVVDLVSSQRGVAVCLDPHARHSIVKDLVVLNEAQTCWVKNHGHTHKQPHQAESTHMNKFSKNLSCRLKSLHSGLPRSCCAWFLGCSPSCKVQTWLV